MITIRPISKSDDEEVRKLILSILEKEFPVSDRAYFGEDIEKASQSYGNGGEAFFVACDGERIVGTVGIKREDDRNALLRRIFVRPEYRGKKIGMQLIQSAIEFCKGNGYGEIIFKTTSRMQDANRLCEANGFVRRATVPLGEFELFKFTKHLNDKSTHTNNSKNSQKKNHVFVSEKEKRRKS